MLSQVRTQKHQFNVLPQQIQLLKLFHLTTLELQQRIQEELNENPLLEENTTSDDDQDNSSKDTVQDYQDEEEYKYDDIPDYKLEHNNYLSEQNMPQRPIAELYDFRKDLKEQIRFIIKDQPEVDLADYLIDSLNESGMLEQNLEALTDDYSFKKHQIIEPGQIEKIRSIIKEIEPGGVGCFTIKEFLLFQLSKMNTSRPDVMKAICLLEKHFENLTYRNTEKITELLQLDEDELQIVLQLIRTCKPKPLTELDTTASFATVIPDFIVREDGDGFEISLYRQRSATLFINQSMSKMITKQNGADKGAQQYLKSKLNSAQWFVDAIKQRENTMQKVMRVIVELQQEYFRNGDIAQLKPMILKNVADRTSVDISTVSRITCNKYADTHFGTIRLKDLFSEGIENEQGENISNRVIQSAIEDVVRSEDKKSPLTDQQLVTVLSMKGFNIARRTVAKYREQLRIPAVQLRAMWVS
jgi:RNA polymerase sigma-54 factor